MVRVPKTPAKCRPQGVDSARGEEASIHNESQIADRNRDTQVDSVLTPASGAPANGVRACRCAGQAGYLDCPLEMRDAEKHFGAFRRWEGAAWAPQFPRLSGTPNAETARPRMNCSAACTRNCTGWRNGNW